MDKKSNQKKIDMTTGSIMNKVILFALPILFGNILQYLYTTVDTLVIGNYCGSTSLAAVGTSAQPVEVLLCVFLGIGSGVSIMVSQYAGKNDLDKIRDACKTAVAFVYFCGLPMIALGVICAPLILKMMGVPEDVWDIALIYTRIVLLGSLGNIGYNMNAGILRGMGDSKASLWFLIVSCVANIILDYVFVAGMGMGAGGAALSTTIAMYLSWVVSIVYIRRRFPELSFPIATIQYVPQELKFILAIGVPMGLNNSLFSFGHIALQIFVNAQGSAFMAGASVAGRINGLANIAITAIASAATTFSGQNFGAKNYRRLKEGHLWIPLMNGVITFLFGAICIMIRKPILRLFTDDADVLFYASRYVTVMLRSQWMYAVFHTVSCIVNGTGKVRYTTLINLLMLWAMRVPAAFIITRYFDGQWVMLAYPISFFFGMVCMLLYYVFSKNWKGIMKLAEEQRVCEWGSE